MIDIKKLRKAKNMTQKEFGALLGYDQGFISSIESCKAPMPDNMLKVLKKKFPHELAAYTTEDKKISSVPLEFVESIFKERERLDDERKRHDEIVLSQQRTIEELVKVQKKNTTR